MACGPGRGLAAGAEDGETYARACGNALACYHLLLAQPGARHCRASPLHCSNVCSTPLTPPRSASARPRSSCTTARSASRWRARCCAPRPGESPRLACCVPTSCQTCLLAFAGLCVPLCQCWRAFGHLACSLLLPLQNGPSQPRSHAPSPHCLPLCCPCPCSKFRTTFKAVRPNVAIY